MKLDSETKLMSYDSLLHFSLSVPPKRLVASPLFLTPALAWLGLVQPVSPVRQGFASPLQQGYLLEGVSSTVDGLS